MQYKTLLLTLTLLAALLLGVAGAAAQSGGTTLAPQAALGGGFTYQGYLTDAGGVAIDDSCDFRFRLYDAASSGTQLGTSDFVTGQQVVDGYFTVTVNGDNEFGSQPFDGNERFIEVGVACTGASGYTTLTPRHKLSAVPYAAFALNIPAHDHYGELWHGTGSPYALAAINENPTGVGLIASGASAGISAAGGILVTEADSDLYISPQAAVVRYDSTEVTLSPMMGGGMAIDLPASSTVKIVSVPLATYGTLFGSDVYVKSIEVCYKGTAAIITTMAVAKNTGTMSGEAYYILDNTDRTSGTYACYTVSATTPRTVIDNTSWVQFNLQNPSSAALSVMEIYTIKVTLTEEQN